LSEAGSRLVDQEGTAMSNRLIVALLFGASLLSSGPSEAQTRPPILEQIAKTYGIDSFGNVEAIRYTFNLELSGKTISRSWVWEPKTEKVTYEGEGKDGKPLKVTYLQSELYKEPETVQNDVDPAFVNDNYWVIFPFHAYWDWPGADVQDKGTQKLPSGEGSARLVSVKYSSKGGYTPGDTWDLYVGDDNRIKQFAYHRGGPKKPQLVTTSWEGYKQAGPLLFSTDHRGTADGSPVRVSFSNVAVKLVGSENWIEAK
jgi:hypothetical protein